MLFIFRKLRRSFFLPGKVRTYVAYAVGEIALIMIGILLALQVSDWNQGKEDREEERRLLGALRDELIANGLLVETQLRFQRAMTEASMSLLQVYASQQELSDDDLDKLLGSLVWHGKTWFRTGVTTGLLQSGKLSLIQDESLRNQIASIPGRQAFPNSEQDGQRETYMNVLMPFLYKHAAIPQLSNAQPSSPGTAQAPQPPLPIRQPKSHKHLMELEEFQGIVTEMFWEQNDIITRLTEYQTFANGLIAKIDATLTQMDQ